MLYIRKLREKKTKADESFRTVSTKDEYTHSPPQPSQPVTSFRLDRIDLESYICPGIDKIYFIPNLITEEQEAYLLSCICGEVSDWVTLKTRRLKCFSTEENAEGTFPLPDWLQALLASLVECGAWTSEAFFPNHVLINEYKAGQGILHHTDGPSYLNNTLILSLLSSAMLTFRRKLGAGEIGVTSSAEERKQRRLFLTPRSLLRFESQAYDAHLHGIEEMFEDAVDNSDGLLLNYKSVGLENGAEIPRGQRISLTIRHKFNTGSGLVA